MSNSAALVTIDTIVRRALADKGENTLYLYPRYLHYALTMFRKINKDYSENIKTVSLPVSATNTVQFPSDYIAYNKMGIKLGDRLMCFQKDNTITVHKDDAYTKNSKFFPEANNQFGTYYFYNYDNTRDVDSTNAGNYFLEVNGYAHNGVGYFKENAMCSEFQLSSEVVAKNVILEYIYNEYDPNSETLVPALAEDVLKEFIHYQYARFSKSISISKVREEEREYLDELATYNMRLSDVSFQGILDVSRRSQTRAPKM